jgi:hypothetical protein
VGITAPVTVVTAARTGPGQSCQWAAGSGLRVGAAILLVHNDKTRPGCAGLCQWHALCVPLSAAQAGRCCSRRPRTGAAPSNWIRARGPITADPALRGESRPFRLALCLCFWLHCNSSFSHVPSNVQSCSWMNLHTMELNAIKDQCLRLCTSIREDVMSSVLDVETRVCSNSEKFSTKSTVRCCDFVTFASCLV